MGKVLEICLLFAVTEACEGIGAGVRAERLGRDPWMCYVYGTCVFAIRLEGMGEENDCEKVHNHQPRIAPKSYPPAQIKLWYNNVVLIAPFISYPAYM